MKPLPKKSTISNASLKRSLSLIVAVFGFLLYAQTISYTFVLDDTSAITQNHIVQEGFRGIGTLIHTSYRYGYWAQKDEIFRPLSLILFAIEWQFFPDSAAAFHLLNILLYSLTGFLLFHVLARLLKDNLLVAFIATLLFITHPVHTEVVAYIKCGDEILSFLFFLITLNFLLDFIKSNSQARLTYAAITFFLALLAKETAMTFVLIIPITIFFFAKHDRSQLIKVIAALTVAILPYLLLRYFALGGIVNTKQIAGVDNIIALAPDYASRAATAIYVLGKYLVTAVLPIHLSIDYSASEITIIKPSDIRFIIPCIVFTSLLTYAFSRFRNRDLFAFAILLFCISIAIVSNLFIVIGTVMADRLLYIPSLGICMAVAMLLFKLFNPVIKPKEVPVTLRDFIKINRKTIAIAAIIIGLFSLKTISRNPVWRDNNSLYITGVEDAPNSSRNHYLYALYLLDNVAIPEQDPSRRNQFFEETINEFKTSLTLYPADFKAFERHQIILKKQDKQILLETYKMIAITYRHQGDTANTNLFADKANAIEASK